MKIADSCRDPMEWFGLDQWVLRRTVTQADEKSVVQMHGKVPMLIGFYEKEHRDRRVIAIRFQKPDNDYVGVAFAVPPTIETQPTPLDTLREVCEKYGGDLQVGDVETKFLIQAEVPLPGPVIEGIFPKDHKSLVSMLVMVTERRTALVALAFALDVTEMQKDL